MIRIRKPASPPAHLAERGPAATDALCSQVETSRETRLSFDKNIYGAAEVKRALSSAQHDKCCFCESKVSQVAYGDVEHFRPKAAVRASADGSEQSPGYYWLAYAWSNLYFACEQCNRRHKRNLFPLENEDDRVVSHEDGALLSRERPLYIDPGSEDPEAFIGFRKEYARAQPGEGFVRGAATVDNLGLNRNALCERRRERRALLLTLLRNVRSWLADGCKAQFRGQVEQTLALVVDATSDDAEHAGMARALVRDVIPWRAVCSNDSPPDLLAQLEDDALQARWFAIPPR